MSFFTKLRKRFFCDGGDHSWEYYIAGNRLIAVNDEYAFVDIPMRYCKVCKRIEEKRFNDGWVLYKTKES